MLPLIRSALIVLGASLFVMLSAKAADITMTLAGTVVATPCEVAGGNTMTVNLGTYEEVVSNSDNYVYDINYFDLNLINCPVAWDNVNLLLEGEWDAENQVLVNTGTAKNVGIKVYVMKSGSTWGLAQECMTQNVCAYPINKETGQVTIHFSAHMINLAEAITQGTVTGQLVFTLTYQ